MTNWNDPEGAAEIYRAKFDTAAEEYQAGRMSDDVFIATLFQLGFRSARLWGEYRFQEAQRYQQLRGNKHG